MVKATYSEIKRRKGRPGVGEPGVASVPVMLRLSPETAAEIDRAVAEALAKGNTLARNRQDWIREVAIEGRLMQHRAQWEKPPRTRRV